MATTKRHSPAYLWVHLSQMKQVIWASAYASAKGRAQVRAGVADRTVRSLEKLESRRESDFGPEHEAARSTVMLELPEFEAWYRVQLKITKNAWAKDATKDECIAAFDRYRRGLGDFY